MSVQVPYPKLDQKYACNPASMQKCEQAFQEFVEFFKDNNYAAIMVEYSAKQENALVIKLFGEKNSLHDSSQYMILMVFPSDYPKTVPHTQFVGFIPFHFNIEPTGAICLDYLAKWQPHYTAQKLAIQIEFLLYNPFLKHGYRQECLLNSDQRRADCKAVAQNAKEQNRKLIF